MFSNHQALHFDNPNAPYGRAETFTPWRFTPRPLNDGALFERAPNREPPAIRQLQQPVNLEMQQQQPIVARQAQEDHDTAAEDIFLRESEVSIRDERIEHGWQAKFCELQQYKKEHGHVQIPQKYPTNQKLATWLQSQRFYSLNENSARKIKCVATRERRRQQLQSLGVAFPDVQQQGKPDQREASPNQEVQRPAVEEKDPVTPPVYDDDEEEQPLVPLNGDVDKSAHKDIQYETPLQGEEAREFPSALVQQEAVLSPKLQQDEKDPGGDGVQQDREASTTANLAERNEQTWQASFRELERFKEQHGHVRVPKKYPPNQELSNWLQISDTSD